MADSIAAVMTPDPVTVAPHTSFKDILELLATRAISAVPVVSATGLVVGVVSDVDLVRDRLRRRRPGSTRLTANELMRRPAVTVSPDTTLAVATRLLAERSTPRSSTTSSTPASSVRVDGGVVQLTGHPHDRDDRDALITRISAVPGVIDIKERTYACAPPQLGS